MTMTIRVTRMRSSFSTSNLLHHITVTRTKFKVRAEVFPVNFDLKVISPRSTLILPSQIHRNLHSIPKTEVGGWLGEACLGKRAQQLT